MTVSRRDAIAAYAAGGITGGTAVLAGQAAADSHRSPPDHVTVSYDEAPIKKYQPSLVLEDVEPEPQSFHALHAESDKSDLNAVYGFAKYPSQDGASRQDSHLGDHEPIITWYDPVEEEAVRTDYAAYHWFRGTLVEDAIPTATDANQRPKMYVDPTYHHYYRDDVGVAGERLEVKDLTESVGRWLDEGLEDSLALSQPYNPWGMLSRESWWRHNAGNWIDASLKALWFNLGLSDAAATSDLDEVDTW
jgi:hypothetical protein